MTADEGRWDYTEDGKEEQTTYDYDPDELERARQRMNAEKDVLNKEEDLFTGDTKPLEHQKGGEDAVGNDWKEGDDFKSTKWYDPEDPATQGSRKKEAGSYDYDVRAGEEQVDEENKCENCERAEDFLNDDGLCEDCEREAGIDRKESERDAYEGGVGSGRKRSTYAPEPEQIARSGDPHYDPYKATPQSQRVQTDPVLSRMTEEAPDDIDPIFGKAEEDSTISVAGPPANTQPPANMFDDEEDESPIEEVFADEVNTSHEPAGSSKGGQFATKDGDGDTGGKSENKLSSTSDKDLIKSIKGGSKDWHEWGRNEKTEDAYAEIERRNKEIPTPKRPEGARGTIFRDDPDAVSKMEAKVKYLEDVHDYWKKVTKFPNRDYQNRNQLGDAKYYELSNNSANLRDAKNKLAGIKAQQERGTQLVRKTTYKSDQYGKSKPRFYYSEEPKEETKSWSDIDDSEISASTKKFANSFAKSKRNTKGTSAKDIMIQNTKYEKLQKIDDQVQKELGFSSGKDFYTRSGMSQYKKAVADKLGGNYDGVDKEISEWLTDDNLHSMELVVSELKAGIKDNEIEDSWDKSSKEERDSLMNYKTDRNAKSYDELDPIHQSSMRARYVDRKTGDESYAKEVDLNTMNQAHVWWDNKFPDRPWSDMRIGDRQHAILAFLRDPDTEITVESKATESEWIVHTTTKGKIPVTLGEQAEEIDAINEVNRMYFEDGFIDENDVLSAVKVGESKATEEQINTDTWYHDYSEYWKKGSDYVRSGLALQANITTDWTGTEWDDLPADIQAKIRDAGYVTSYETYDKMSWEFLPSTLKEKLGEGFTPVNESVWSTSTKEQRREILKEVEPYGTEEVTDDSDIDILDRLLNNEEEEQEHGEDEEEDIALIAQLLDPEADEVLKKSLEQSPNALMRYSEPIDLPTGKNALDQTYGVSEPETPDGQDLTGITIGEEEIIEKKFTPPKILYYKQYPFGRRAGKQNPFGESLATERDFYTSNKDIMDQALDIQAQEEFGKDYDQLNPTQADWIDKIMNDYGNTLNPEDKPSSEAKEFESPIRDQYGNPYPTPEGDADCTFCGKKFDNWDVLGDHITIVHNDQGRTREFYGGNAPQSILNHPDWTGYAGEAKAEEARLECYDCDRTFNNISAWEEHGEWHHIKVNTDQPEALDEWGLPELADEGGQGSGRKQYKSEDPKSKDKAHIGWKNYGIDDYIDKAEQDYFAKESVMDSIAKGECPFCGFTGGNEEIYKHLAQDHMEKDVISLGYLGDLDRLMLNDTGIAHHGLTDEAKEQLEDPTPWASLAHLAGTTVKDILFPSKEQAGGGGAGGAGGAGGNGAGAPSGNGGEAPTNGNGEDEEPSRRIGFFGYGRHRNCPKGQVYKNGKCVDRAEEKTCPVCNGKGKYFHTKEEDWYTCPKCSGDGEVSAGEEGGKGSGKKDHKLWMRAIEEEHTYDFCENCSMITEQVNHKCAMCGKQVE